MHNSQMTATFMPLLVMAVVLLVRSRHIGRDRPFNPTTNLILPLIVLVGFGVMMAAHPPSITGWAALGIGMLLGLPLGFKRARLTHLGHDRETGKLTIRHSAAAMFLLLGVVALRQLARLEIMEAGGHGYWLDLISQGLMGFAVGCVCAFRGELWYRANRLRQAA